jgi:hypothetical protein
VDIPLWQLRGEGDWSQIIRQKKDVGNSKIFLYAITSDSHLPTICLIYGKRGGKFSFSFTAKRRIESKT